MQKIGSKTKTIIIIIISLIIIIGYIIPISMSRLAKNVSYNNRGKVIKLYQIYLNTLSFTKKDEALYNLANLILPYIDTYDILMWGKGGGGFPATKENVETAIGYYEEILSKYKNSKYHNQAYKKILDIYTGLGELDKVYELLDMGKMSSNKELVYISDLYRAFYYFADGEYDNGLDIVNNYLDKGREDIELYYLKGHIYFALEDYEKAKEVYELADKSSVLDREKGNLFGNLKIKDRSLWMKDIIKYKGDLKIRGKATYDGKPIPFAQIYLRDISEAGTYSSNGMHFVAITDINGNFETVGFKEGTYEIGIGISKFLAYDMVYLDDSKRNLELYEDTIYDFHFVSPMEMVIPKGEYILKDEEFTITWEEVEGAEYYTINATSFDNPLKMEGSSAGFSIPSKNGEYHIKENRAILSLEVLNSALGGIFYEGEDMTINPQAILGVFFPGNNVPVSINAYDKNRTLISSSLPLISSYDNGTIIKVRNRELTEGENLILQKKYEEAVDYYEAQIDNDENNLEALTYLSKLYTKGWKKDTVDPDKAEKYSFRLYDLTKDKNILESLCKSIAMKDKEKFIKIGNRVFDLIPDEDLNEGLIWEKGRYYLLKGDFNKGQEYYEMIGESYVNSYIIYIDIFNREFDKALNRLEDDNMKFYYMGKKNLNSGIEGLKELDEKSKEWKDFKDFLSKVITNEISKEHFYKIYKSINETNINLILKEIGVENHWIK
ncbi:hypothetical protein [Schnuerera sp.]|uniref:tetratricopeptide repeat protein n=1 Tax=Schnuerera sp. TaxID=2794844 RepID=UPI002C4437E8|nr:hypothetical protein [Schnuerera sp.]HSH36339.1 hypothetical protein [Schnuerera sp.]